MSSVKANIIENIATRIASVTSANFYSTNVKKVYYDEIPMGIDLAEHQLPAIFLIEGVDQLATQHKVMDNLLNLIVQLWHNEPVGDFVMAQFVRDVYKAIYANSPSALTESEFRSIHPKIVEFIPLRITPDLHMIEANRVTELSFNVRYRTNLYDL